MDSREIPISKSRVEAEDGPHAATRGDRAGQRREAYAAGIGAAVVSDRDVPHRRKINPGPPAQRFMKPPLSRYIALAQRRTMVLMSRRGPLLEKNRTRPLTALSHINVHGEPRAVLPAPGSIERLTCASSAFPGG